MRLEPLGTEQMADILALFCSAFQADEYYARLFPDPHTRAARMRQEFAPSFAQCVAMGGGLGAFENGALKAFLLYFDYRRVREDHPSLFREIFGEGDTPLCVGSPAHARIAALPGRVLFLLSIAVAPALRRQGLASAMLDALTRREPDCSLAADVSHEGSLALYLRRGFRMEQLSEGYNLLTRAAGQPEHTVDFGPIVRLLVPDTGLFKAYGLFCHTLKERCWVADVEAREQPGLRCFARQSGGLCPAALVELRYDQLLRYQRLINPAQCEECLCGDSVYYCAEQPYDTPPLLNGTLRRMLGSRAAEWAVVPDVFISIPMKYRDGEGILRAEAARDPEARDLMRQMDFRMRYEAGIPSGDDEVDDLAGFKTRIRRAYLGKAKLQILGEMTPEGNGAPIGPPALVDLYVALDTHSNCAVLTLFSLSAPFLLSHLLDNMSRNQLSIAEDDRSENLFGYLSRRYGLLKRGTPKAYVVIPQPHTCLTPAQRASLLAAETIYPDGENFGELVDKDLLAIVNAERGMGQYDRGMLYAHTHVVLQFSPDFRGSLRDRLAEESIALFYIELLLMEEAAIKIADREIIRLLSEQFTTEPVDFLRRVDAIYDDYSRTTEFWNLQVNYPTSQKSIDMLREAFGTERQFKYMQKNRDQLQAVFDTKSDIIDRESSRRVDTSLAILSVLAVLSAWIDGHQYLETWSDVLSPAAVHIAQRALFLLILLVAVYAVGKLFGPRIARLTGLRRRPRQPRDGDGEEDGWAFLRTDRRYRSRGEGGGGRL